MTNQTEKPNENKITVAFATLCLSVMLNFGLTIWWASHINTLLNGHLASAGHPDVVKRVSENATNISNNTVTIANVERSVVRIETKLDLLIGELTRQSPREPR